MFDGDLGTETIGAIDNPLGVLLAISVAAWYHWKVFQSDREHAPEFKAPEPRTVTVVTSSELSGLDAPGVTFKTLAPESDQEITDSELVALTEMHPTGDLMIVRTSTAWEAIALARR